MRSCPHFSPRARCWMDRYQSSASDSRPDYRACPGCRRHGSPTGSPLYRQDDETHATVIIGWVANTLGSVIGTVGSGSSRYTRQAPSASHRDSACRHHRSQRSFRNCRRSYRHVFAGVHSPHQVAEVPDIGPLDCTIVPGFYIDCFSWIPHVGRIRTSALEIVVGISPIPVDWSPDGSPYPGS